jgi:hypothetical protein
MSRCTSIFVGAPPNQGAWHSKVARKLRARLHTAPWARFHWYREMKTNVFNPHFKKHFFGQLTFLIIAQHPRPQSPLTTSSFSLPLSAPPAASARQPRIPELRSFFVLCSIPSLHFTTYRAPVLYSLLSFRAASLDSRHFPEWHSLVPRALPLSSVFLSGKRRVAGHHLLICSPSRNGVRFTSFRWFAGDSRPLAIKCRWPCRGCQQHDGTRNTGCARLERDARRERHGEDPGVASQCHGADCPRARANAANAQGERVEHGVSGRDWRDWRGVRRAFRASTRLLHPVWLLPVR